MQHGVRKAIYDIMEVTNKKKGNNMGQLISAQNKEFIQQFDVQKVEMDYLYQALNVDNAKNQNGTSQTKTI